MPPPSHWQRDAPPREDANRQTATLAGVAIVLLLLVVGLYLVHTLQGKARVEDCLMAGRADCDRLVPSATRR